MTSITLLAIKRAEAKAGRKLSFVEAATPGTPHLELMLALLTKAQWRVAVNLPRLMNDADKLIEQHRAEYR